MHVDGDVLTGVVPFVLDGHIAQLLLVGTADGVYAVDAGNGVTAELLETTDQTRRLARVTLPVWIYVSVTGVVVYLMLYHLPGGR